MTYLPLETRIVNALRAAGITVPVYRGDTVPDTVAPPYVLVHPGPITKPTGRSRRRDTGDTWAVQRVYVEVYQYLTNERGQRVENPALPLRVLLALDRADLPGTVTPLVVESSTRVPDPDPRVRHDSLTVRAEESLTDALNA